MKRWLLAAALLAGCSPSGSSTERLNLHLLTSPSLFWGEGDIASAVQHKTDRPPLIRHLEATWRVVPLDIARPDQLRPVSLLLVIQPQALAPDELVALDDWVRAGGHALILADPDLRGASSLKKGDARQPPPSTLLLPLLSHWGLTLVPDPPGVPRRMIRSADGLVPAPGSGRWISQSRDCTVTAAVIARCTLGKGVAVSVADADFAISAKDSAAQEAGQRLIDQLLEGLGPDQRRTKEENQDGKWRI
jgi:hypothetical protein